MVDGHLSLKTIESRIGYGLKAVSWIFPPTPVTQMVAHHGKGPKNGLCSPRHFLIGSASVRGVGSTSGTSSSAASSSEALSSGASPPEAPPSGAPPSGISPPGAEDRPAGRGARPARRRLSVDRRREELVAAALELFGGRDAEDVSIDDVASVAGTSRALVYHYFGGKQELYVAALRSAADQLEARLRPSEVGGPVDRPVERLGVGLRRYFDFVEERAAGYAALVRGGPANRSGEVGEIVDGVRHRLLGLVMRLLRVEEAGPVLRVTLRSWIASVETAALDWLERRDVDRRVVERILVDQMVATLGVAARHDPRIVPLLENLVSEHAP